MTKRLTLTALVVATILFILVFFYRRIINTPITQESKLVDCTGAVVACSFTPPKGWGFSMVMAGDSPFSGQVRIERQGNAVVTFGIDSRRAKHCNWLQAKGIPEAWIITEHPPGLQQHLVAGDEHKIIFAFDRAPDTNASIWMKWIEAYGDGRRK